MKLFVNGCSFTHGHKDWPNNMQPPSWVWPYQITNSFDEVVNLAWQGGSNHRIVRTTLDYFDQMKDTNEWLAVIQWTTPYSRSELYDEKTDTYFGYFEGSPNPVFDLTANTKFVVTPKDFYRSIELHRQSSLIRTNVEMESMFIFQNFILAEFFKKKNIPFIFVSLSSHSYIHPENRHPIAKLLPRNNMLDTTLNSFINPNITDLIESETDFHPNNEGHKVIAKYITRELQKRNYI